LFRYRPAVAPALDPDQALVLQDPQGLAQRRPRHDQLGHQLQLGGQQFVLGQLAHDDLTAQLRCHQLGGLRYLHFVDRGRFRH
jgi:hypothetical protein